MGFCEDLMYAPLGSGCGVSRNDESVDTLAYITRKVETANRIYYKLSAYFKAIKENINQEGN